MAATYEIVDGEDPLRALLDACDRELGAFVVQKYPGERMRARFRDACARRTPMRARSGRSLRPSVS